MLFHIVKFLFIVDEKKPFRATIYNLWNRIYFIGENHDLTWGTLTALCVMSLWNRQSFHCNSQTCLTNHRKQANYCHTAHHLPLSCPQCSSIFSPKIQSRGTWEVGSCSNQVLWNQCEASSTTVSLCLSSVHRACHGLPDQFLEGSFPDRMFPHNLGSDDESQSKICILTDRIHK